MNLSSNPMADKWKKRGQRKNTNPNPIPRDEDDLPDFDQLMVEYEPTIAKVTQDIKSKWFQQVKVHELHKEVRATVMLIISLEWDRYKKGEIDEFPPYAGYLYKSAFWEFKKQYAPQHDLTIHAVEFYNCVDGSISCRNPNIIPGHGNYQEFDSNINVECENVPFKDPPDKYQQDWGNMPDIVDWWYIGCTVRQLCIMFSMDQATIKKILHDKYDAMLFSGEKPQRPRPRRQRTKMGQFHTMKMMMAGRNFNRWTVIKQAGSDKHNRLIWLCRCECGTERVVSGTQLRRGKSKSCGCLRGK